MKPTKEGAQPGGHAFPMFAEFSAEDAASLIKMQLGTLTRCGPIRNLVEKVRWYAVSLSQCRYGGIPKMRRLLGNLEDHLTTLDEPAVAPDDDSEPSA
jgi:hypothetical protein